MSALTALELDRTVEAGVERLLELQEPGGWWVGELESNVTMTAQHLLFLEFMGIRDDETTARVMTELLARQRPDGLWSIYHGGEPDLNATIEAYAALRLAGLSEHAPQLADALRFCRERGGIGAARVFTRIWLSLFGIWSWDDVPQLLPELVLLRTGPDRFILEALPQVRVEFVRSSDGGVASIRVLQPRPASADYSCH